MKLFEKWYTSARLTILTFFENLKQIKIDKVNRKKFLADIQQEVLNVNSKFNLYRLSMDDTFTKMSCYITVPENYQLAGTDALIYSKLREEARAINEYIGKEIGWGEYFVAPEFFYVEDPDDVENVSCTYIAVWRYEPVLKKFPKFWKQFAAFVGINATLLFIILGIILLLI